MLNSEKLAIAAHLHVLLRRKTGRVTDTEWMARNTEYAIEIIRFARASAQTDGHVDLGEWADKLAAALSDTSAVQPPVLTRLYAASHTPKETQPPTEPSERYVRGIR